MGVIAIIILIVIVVIGGLSTALYVIGGQLARAKKENKELTMINKKQSAYVNKLQKLKQNTEVKLNEIDKEDIDVESDNDDLFMLDNEVERRR